MSKLSHHVMHCIFYCTVYTSLYTPANDVWGVYRNHLVCLSVHLSVQSKLNLDYNFLTKWDRAFILHMYVPCDKTFLFVPKVLTLWPWPWLLTYFWKNLTLAITFESKEIGLSYNSCVFFVARPFCWYQKFWPCDHYLELWPTFEKNLTLALTFEPKQIEHSYYTCVFLMARPLFRYQIFQLLTLTSNFWPTFEKS